MTRYIYTLILSTLVSFSLASAGLANTKKAEYKFNHDGLNYEIKRFENYIKKQPVAKQLTQKKLLQEASQSFRKQYYHSAILSLTLALSFDADDAGTWLQLAQAYIKAKPANGREKYDFPQKASITAYKAYQLTSNKNLKAKALATLGQALKRRSYWRPAINAYKLSLEFNENAETRTAYQQLRAQHGFRVINYRTDSETANPRICIQFSEVLKKGNTDFTKYISVDAKDPAGVVAEAKQLCVEGLLHGKRYVIRVREGLPSKIGENILKTSDLVVYVRDRRAAVRFSGKGYVLPKTGQAGLPLISTNTDKVGIEIYRVGDRALNRVILDNFVKNQTDKYQISQLKNNHAKKVWSGEMDVKSKLNKDVTTALPVTKAIKDLKPGFYVAYAWPKNGKEKTLVTQATQWFVVSDIGISNLSGAGGMHTFVRTLTTAEPVKGVQVKLLARSNEVLGKAVSDANGHVKFDKGLLKGKGSQAPHLIIAEREEGDYAFLNVTHSSFDLTDRGVKGRAVPGPLDAFLFTERGVYRAGEQVYLTALLRDSKGVAVPKVPVTLIIKRADGVEFGRVTLQDEGEGGRSHIIALPNNAGSGRWSASIYTDPKAKPIGHVSFLVEDYTPQRMEMELAAKQKVLDRNKSMQIDAIGRYLYGAPASNLAVNGEILIREKKKGLEKFKGYRFGAYDEKFLAINKQLTIPLKTDANGALTLKTPLLEIPTSSKILEAQVTLRLNEPGGRSLAKQITLDVKPDNSLIGIKPLFGDHVGEGEAAEFDIISINPDRSQTALKGLKWEILKIEKRYQWYSSSNGYWNYETITYTRKVANGTIDTKSGSPVRISKPLDWGSYRLDITSDKANGPQASYKFSSGWHTSGNVDRPDKLEIALDKKSYKAGDTLSVNLSPKFDGKALVAIVDNKILAIKTVNVRKNGTKIDFPVDKNWGAGTYVTAMFYRPMDEKARRMPARSIGLAWLKPDVQKKTLDIALEVPEKIRPNKPLNIPVKISGLKAGQEAKIVISAVDVGILNLTNYKAPDPKTWYYGQRLMGTEIRDLYGKLIDGMQAASGKIRSGGGALGNGFGNPPARSIEPIALYSGIVIVDKDGKANITFDVPEFDGTIRLMAVAWNTEQLGNTQKDVIVRDPVVVIGTAPKFLTTGDKSNIHFSMDNIEGPAGKYTYSLTGTGSVDIDSKPVEITLAEKERKQFTIPVQAKDYGKATVKLAVNGPDNFSLERSFNFDVNPAAPNITRQLISSLPKNGAAFNITKDVTQGLIPETIKVSVNVSKNPLLDVPGLLLALDRYPYGCAEQTTSRALPLLYLEQVANKVGVTDVKATKDRINKAIARLAGMQGSNGSFGLWSPYSGGNTWLTAYVTDFLTRAKEKGYKVPDLVFNQALDNLQNRINYASDFKSGGEDLAYALYVLARNGRAGIGDLRYFVDAKLDNFSTALAKAQLGASLAMYGDKDRANQAYSAALSSMAHSVSSKGYRSDYGSDIRDGAAAITLISETKSTTIPLNAFSDLLNKARSLQTYTSTQENAWLLLAANALQEEDKNLKLAVNGVPKQGALKTVLNHKDLLDGKYTITNRNDNEIKASLIITGHGASPLQPESQGFEIKREFYTLDGKPAKLDTVKQNDRFVVVLKVTEKEAKRGRLILVDRIPGGFEIENPKLVTGSDVKTLSWLPYARGVEHSQFKDDRFLAAFNMSRVYKKKKPATLTTAYIVRAVSPGTYTHPAATIEDMYRLDRYARTAASKVTIVKK